MASPAGSSTPNSPSTFQPSHSRLRSEPSNSRLQPDSSFQRTHSRLQSDPSAQTTRKRVGFTDGTAPPDDSTPPLHYSTPDPDSRDEISLTPLATNRPDISHEKLAEEVHKAFGQPYIPKPRPAIRKPSRAPPRFHVGVEEAEDEDEWKK